MREIKLPVLDQPVSTKIGTGREHPHKDALLEAPEHVLSTLEKDGSRRWLRPKLAKGLWWHRRRLVAYVLMVVFVVVPHLTINGKPVIRLDLGAREFTILGHTLLPTDTLLLALTLLTAFVSVVFVTAVAGRAWCGWACPQTVYIEYLFRPIDRLFERTVGKGGQPKQAMPVGMQILRFGVYLLLCMFLAHTFLAYFVGPERLALWMRSSPFEQPAAFAVMAVTTLLLIYDFYFFREQTCLIACPYGRFQSVMLDRNSMIVAYDYNRGEPRKKGKKDPAAAQSHCVDCKQCVVVCPTGIDIRHGLQMECINCTQCIDACDTVMDKVGLPRGLIRYTSQDALDNKPQRLLRARTIIYPLILAAIASGLVLAVSNTYGLDARIIRGKGAPFTLMERGQASNNFSMRLVNRTNATQTYALTVLQPEMASIEVLNDETLTLEPGKTSLVPMRIRFPSALTYAKGNHPIIVRVTDEDGNKREIDFRLLGPR
jgi:cytochrome c oxidase accessory protein FixG